MKRMRIASLGGLAAAALAVGLPMLPAQAQPTVLPHGYGGPPQVARQQPQTAHAMSMSADPLSLQVAGQLAAARAATAKYATNLAKAKSAGYMIITKMMPNMGFHYLNPHISGFNIRKPQILVYEHTKTGWQLGALEWVFTKMPKSPPCPTRHSASSRRRATTPTALSSLTRTPARARRRHRRAPSSRSGTPT